MRTTVVCQWNFDCLLTSTSSKFNKYVVIKKIKHLDIVSFWDFFVWISVIFYKVRKDVSFPRRTNMYLWRQFLSSLFFYIYIYQRTNSFDLPISWEWGKLVSSQFMFNLILLQDETFIDWLFSKGVWVSSLHIWFTPPLK